MSEIDWSGELRTEDSDITMDGLPVTVLAEGEFNNQAWPYLVAIGPKPWTGKRVYSARRDGRAVRLNHHCAGGAEEDPTRTRIVNAPAEPKTVTREGWICLVDGTPHSARKIYDSRAAAYEAGYDDRDPRTTLAHIEWTEPAPAAVEAERCAWAAFVVMPDGINFRAVMGREADARGLAIMDAESMGRPPGNAYVARLEPVEDAGND